MDQLLNVSIVWHHFTVAPNLEFKATSVTLQNRIGPLDILPSHANLISVVYNNLTIKTVEGQTKSFVFERGVVEVSENIVRLFLQGKTPSI